MTIEGELRAYLVLDAGVTALVSTRVYQLVAPQGGTFPLVRIQCIDEQEESHLLQPSGLFRTRVQIDSYVKVEGSANPYSDVTAIGTAIHAALSATTVSTLGSSPALTVRGIFLLDRSASYESDELMLVRERRDYAVQYATP